MKNHLKKYSKIVYKGLLYYKRISMQNNKNGLYPLENQRLKITQLEKEHFIEVTELKLTPVELFQLFHFMYVAANAFELFYMAHLAIN